VSDDTRVRSSTYIAGGFGNLFTNVAFGLLVLLGIGAQLGVVATWRRGDIESPQAIFLFAFGVLLTVIGLWFFYARFVTLPAREQRIARISALHPDEPWLLNEAWAARKVIDRSSRASAIFLWIWTAGWWAGCGLIFGVNREKIVAEVTSSWGHMLLAAFFLFCGVSGLIAAVSMTLKWWRYGAATLHIDTLPGYLGNRFRGSILARVPENTPLEAEVVCERVTVIWVPTPKGGRRREETAEPLWSQSWPIEKDRMTRTKDGAAVIPIDVALPEGKPPFKLDADGAGIRWALNLRTDFEGAAKSGPTMPGAAKLERISVQYVIPVYAPR